MPISQDRMLAVVNSAHSAVTSLQSIVHAIQGRIAQVRQDHTQALVAFQDLAELLPELLPPPGTIELIAHERTKLQLNYRANERSAARMRRKRAAQGHLTRSELAVLRTELLSPEGAESREPEGLEELLPALELAEPSPAELAEQEAQLARMTEGLVSGNGINPYPDPSPSPAVQLEPSEEEEVAWEE